MPADRCVFPCFEFGLLRSVHSADCRLDSGVLWSSHVTSIVIYRRINSSLLRLNIAKHCSESSKCCWFWSIVSTSGSYFAHSFCMSKYSCTIWLTRFFDIFRVSTFSINFTLRSFKIILWAFLIFSSVTASFGRLLRASLTKKKYKTYQSKNHNSIMRFEKWDFQYVL
jgi:hypothetical protein